MSQKLSQATIGEGGGSMKTNMNHCCQSDGFLSCKMIRVRVVSRKLQNKLVRSRNGNGKIRNCVTLLHWNLGSKLWPKKLLEIEAVTLQYSPDIFINLGSKFT